MALLFERIARLFIISMIAGIIFMNKVTETVKKKQLYFYSVFSRGRIVVIAEACPPADTGSGKGPLTASYRAAMTQIAMGGSGVSEANGVLRNHCYPPGVI